MSKTVATEQRVHRRHAPTIVRADVELDGERRQGYLMNMSLGGGFLSVEKPPSPDTSIELSVLLPWGLGECRLTARSVWQQVDEEDRAIGAGVSFVDPPEKTIQKLKSYLDRFEAVAAEITD